MTIPNVPPDSDDPEAPDRREPSPDLPPSSEVPPEYPGTDEPDWQAPGSPEDYDAPMRLPSENPDVETEL